MSKTFLCHTFTKTIFDIVVDSPLKPRILNPYLYTFLLYENPSFTIVSADRIYFDKIWVSEYNFFKRSNKANICIALVQ
jgi:hypothetical protein